MSLDDHIGRARALGPGAAARAGSRHGLRLLGGVLSQLRWFFKRTYGPPLDPKGFAERVPVIAPELLEPHAETLRRVTPLYLEHKFDLLGSGWVQVAHGMKARGFDGTVFPPAPAPEDVTMRLNPGNRGYALRLRKLIDVHYLPIDWHIDFKSGYRWREDRVSEAIVYGHAFSVDIKVPWELARMQHLAQLAWAFVLAGAGAAGFRDADIYAREFRNQVLDFLAANPPGFGVNWASPMDVAIRGANIALALDLFRRHGAQFDEPFARALASGFYDHAAWVARRLGRGREVKGNHYLGEICGLAFAAAYLPRAPETEVWLGLAGRELIAETARQFLPDGGHFEGSTAYHRLCAEMVCYATALLRNEIEFPETHFEALARIAAFTEAVTKPDGHAAQIGDNDSGRFFKLCPIFDLNGTEPAEDHLDFRAGDLEAALAHGLAGGNDIPAAGASAPAPAQSNAVSQEWNREIVIVLPDAGVLDGLTAAAYPDFGLYIWRGPRFFLSVRCGRTGGPGPGAHAHNDQLALELQIDGADWLADPGSYVYTPDPAARNAYRSVLAHAAPRLGEREPARLDQGLFRLDDTARAECLEFDNRHFAGRHVGFGAAVTRTVEVENGRIIVRDGFAVSDGRESVEIRDAAALRDTMGVHIPFSRGYGIRTSG